MLFEMMNESLQRPYMDFVRIFIENTKVTNYLPIHCTLLGFLLSRHPLYFLKVTCTGLNVTGEIYITLCHSNN